MANFTSTQGRYLSFIQTYTDRHGFPPAEAEIAAALCVSPPSVHQMVKTLERKGLILREPGMPRSLRVLVPDDEIPSWNGQGKRPSRAKQRPNRETPIPAAPPADLYVLTVFLVSGPVTGRSASKEVRRVIEIRGDQTLDQLHHAIFEAYDRQEQHPYEFQFGRRPFDPSGPNYGISNGNRKRRNFGDARKTKLDDLELKPERVFGYRFDFSNDWFHQIQVERIERAIPTVTYPRLIKRVGKSPPQNATSRSSLRGRNADSAASGRIPAR